MKIYTIFLKSQVQRYPLEKKERWNSNPWKWWKLIFIKILSPKLPKIIERIIESPIFKSPKSRLVLTWQKDNPATKFQDQFEKKLKVKRWIFIPWKWIFEWRQSELHISKAVKILKWSLKGHGFTGWMQRMYTFSLKNFLPDNKTEQAARKRRIHF